MVLSLPQWFVIPLGRRELLLISVCEAALPGGAPKLHCSDIQYSYDLECKVYMES